MFYHYAEPLQNWHSSPSEHVFLWLFPFPI